jgi:hypothetical protein
VERTVGVRQGCSNEKATFHIHDPFSLPDIQPASDLFPVSLSSSSLWSFPRLALKE